MLHAEPPVHPQKTGELVAERIRRQIVQGKLSVGDRLPAEDELAETFGVARTTLREALRILESEGLIKIKRGRGGGGTVTEPQLDHLARSFALSLQLAKTTVGDLDEARLVIEPQLAARWARSHADDDMDALRAAVVAAAVAAEANDTAAFGPAAASVHEIIIERSGNTTLRTIGILLHELLQRHFTKAATFSDQDQMRRAVRSYRRLIRLIEAGNETGAEEHWRRQMKYMVDVAGRYDILDLFEN